MLAFSPLPLLFNRWLMTPLVVIDMSGESSILLHLASSLRKVHFDYTPQWTHGTPNTFIDSVTFPRVLTDKKYSYRVVEDDTDLGIRAAYEVNSDGSQEVNFLEYNKGYGIPDTSLIKVYVVDPDNGNQYLVAQWNYTARRFVELEYRLKG
ncbi:fungal immunomodulatory protein Fve-domain-containing protein [Trametes maxima]|nr:fungal immunomodulatory protein Fve-domain-containing protein [Trametes maxima]